MESPYSRKAFSLTRLRRLFYLVTPNETTFEKLEDVPSYVDEATPWFLGLVVLEILYSVYKKKDLYRVNDALTSVQAGLLQQTMKVLFCSFEFSMACWIYEHYGLHFLRWDSVWTWIIAFLLVDFTYYWFHRGAHEINIFWAFHQMHHSSEEYNLTTAVRQGMFQNYLAMLYNLPETLILPPTVHMAHLGLNKINQFWVHTQAIKSLGPLEHILVTPAHHRVHHGRNRYCIDKNYSGTLIIWDKLFGTFAAEKDDEPVVYGLVHNVNTFNAFYLQVCHFHYIFFEKVPSMKTFTDKVKALFCGPGWFPGTPRTGNLSDIPEIENPVEKFDIKLPKWLLVYCILQMNFLSLTLQIVMKNRASFTFPQALLYSLFVMFSIQCSGAIFDNKFYVPYLEVVRCTVLYYLLFDKIWPPNKIFNIYANVVIGGAAVFWLITTLSIYVNRRKSKLD